MSRTDRDIRPAHQGQVSSGPAGPAASSASSASSAGPGAAAPPGDFASRVLDVIERIPAGRVMSYGDIAEYLGEGGPRQVGRVLALWGGGVPWWRVVHADGSLLAGHEQAALARYRSEGTPLRLTAARLDMRRARWAG